MNFKKIKIVLSSSEKRTLIFLFLGAIFNLSFASFELLVSFKVSNFWSGAVAVYYMFLSGIKFILLKNEEKLYRFCKVLLFIFNIISSVFVFGILFFGNKTRSLSQIIVLAVYALWRVFLALKDLFYYKNNNYIFSTYKVISLSAALLALFSLQSSMIAVLNIEEVLTKIIGFLSGVCLLTAMFSLSFYMIFYVEKKN